MKSLKDLIKDYGKIFIVSLLFFVLLISINLYSNVETNNNLKIKFLNIGQGDSVLIISPKGEKTLLDTGPNSIVTEKVDSSISILSRNINNILLTHPDLDHVGGTKSIIYSNFPKSLIISTENIYEKYEDLRVSQVNNKNNIDIGGIFLEILSPFSGQLGDSNHNSIVSQIRYGNFKFIFMGDADMETERNIVSQGFIKNSGEEVVLKVGHHGSNTSSSESFLKAVKPRYCIISVGIDNRYGHPKKEVLDILDKYCKEIYRTDEDGSVEFVTDGKNLRIVKDK